MQLGCQRKLGGLLLKQDYSKLFKVNYEIHDHYLDMVLQKNIFEPITIDENAHQTCS